MQYFLEATEEAKTRLRGDVRRYLEETWLNDTEAATEARKQVVRNLLDKLEVHPLSAPEYAKLIANDEDDRPFLKNLEQTGVPGFAGSLSALAGDRRDRVGQRLKEQTALFHERLSVTLRLIRRNGRPRATPRRRPRACARTLSFLCIPCASSWACGRGHTGLF